jgi:HTH-type transcriptional regulator/antitoxin HigA
MTPNPIQSDAEYRAALARVEELFRAKPDTPDGDELELLLLLVEKFEEAAYPTDLPDPLTAIRFRMDQQELTPADMSPYLGSVRTVREVLSGRRPLSLPMIRRLVNDLEIPADVFLRDPAKPPRTRKSAATAGR